MQRVLIGTIGYHNLRNHSLGPILFPRLKAMKWPAWVLVEEMNWGPVAIVQRLQAEPEPFKRVVFLSARPQDPEGRITLYRWQGGLPGEEEIQQRLAEAVTGVISLDNLLIVGEHFKVWPQEVLVVDVAPGRQEAGPSLSERVASQIPLILDTVRDLALGDYPCYERLRPLKGNQLATG